jgi:hypothetical protein
MKPYCFAAVHGSLPIRPKTGFQRGVLVFTSNTAGAVTYTGTASQS